MSIEDRFERKGLLLNGFNRAIINVLARNHAVLFIAQHTLALILPRFFIAPHHTVFRGPGKVRPSKSKVSGVLLSSCCPWPTLRDPMPF